MAVMIGIMASMIFARGGEMTTVYIAMILDWNTVNPSRDNVENGRDSERTHEEPVIAHIFSSREVAEEWISRHPFKGEFWIEEHKVQDSSEI
jgi:hypothetical protein